MCHGTDARYVLGATTLQQQVEIPVPRHTMNDESEPNEPGETEASVREYHFLDLKDFSIAHICVIFS